MDPLWRTPLWQQFGATIDMLENAPLRLSQHALAGTPLELRIVDEIRRCRMIGFAANHG